MISSFRHKGVRRFFTSGDKAGIQAKHAVKLNLQLALLNIAEHPDEMNIPEWNIHPLSGDLKNHWAVSVSDSWRLTFGFDGKHAVLVDYQNCH